jgi:hypothetical protein
MILLNAWLQKLTSSICAVLLQTIYSPDTGKVNLSLCLISYTLYHEDIWPSGGIAPRPGRFTPGKLPPVPTGQEAGWAPEPLWTTVKRKILPLPGCEPAIPTELSRRWADIMSAFRELQTPFWQRRVSNQQVSAFYGSCGHLEYNEAGDCATCGRSSGIALFIADIRGSGHFDWYWSATSTPGRSA